MVKFLTLKKKLTLFEDPSQKKIKRKNLLKAFYLQKRLENTNHIKKNDNYKKILKYSKNYFKLSKNCSDNDLLCPICMDYLIEPRTTICGHSFCEKCFFESMLKFNFCPICKKKIKKKTNCFSKSLSTLIKNYQDTLSPEIKEIYIKRVEENEIWKKEKKVTNFKIGEKYDIKDTENIWCRGELKEITKNKNHADTLLFHYLGWNKIFDEYICSNSERISPLGYFTERTDIPKYNRGENNRLYNYILWERNFVGEINQFFPEMREDINQAILMNREEVIRGNRNDGNGNNMNGIVFNEEVIMNNNDNQENSINNNDNLGNNLSTNNNQVVDINNENHQVNIININNENQNINNENPENQNINNQNPENQNINNQNPENQNIINEDTENVINNENFNNMLINENINITNENQNILNNENNDIFNNQHQNIFIEEIPFNNNLDNNQNNINPILNNELNNLNNNDVNNSNGNNNNLNNDNGYEQRIMNQLMDEVDREENWNN